MLKFLHKTELEYEENNNNLINNLTFLSDQYFTYVVLKKKFYFNKSKNTYCKNSQKHHSKESLKKSR